MLKLKVAAWLEIQLLRLTSDNRTTLPVPDSSLDSSRFDPEVVGLSSVITVAITILSVIYQHYNEPAGVFRLSWKYCLIQTAVRIQEEQHQKQVWYVSEQGGCRCILQTRRLGSVYSSAARALIFIQASTCIQTVIHAGPRQRDATEKTKHHTYKLPSHTDTHEWVTCSCVSYLGTGILVSQSPCENKDGII